METKKEVVKNMEIKKEVKNSHAIHRISVKNLFGQFSYDLGDNNLQSENANLFILYGDNGSGKTTILQVLTHLLSPQDARGHKSFVAKTPFQSFAVSFADGTTVMAERQAGQIIGSYTASISKNGVLQQSVDYMADDSNAIISQGENEKVGTRLFLSALKKLDTSLYYLSDDRKMHEDSITSKRRRKHRLLHNRPIVQQRFIAADGTVSFYSDPPQEATPLEEAMYRVHEWVRDQADIDSRIGERNTNKIYNEVIQLIIDSPSSVEEGIASQIEQLKSLIQTLSERSREYSKYGLISPLLSDIIQVLDRLQEVSPEKSRVVYNVLRPYAEGIEARLDALRNIYETLRTFMDILNAFYKNKTVSFKLREGLKISDKQNARLEPRMLSSGEKQILLLFCNTVAAKEQASIFIIDEPEISLNIKWQRQLIQALLNCVKGSPVQFILATHSIELLAQYNHQVYALDNTKIS